MAGDDEKKDPESGALIPKPVKLILDNSFLKDKWLLVGVAVAATFSIILLGISFLASYTQCRTVVTVEEIESAGELLAMDNGTWRGFDHYQRRIAALATISVPKAEQYQVIPRGPYGFVHFSAYRIDMRTFVSIGSGAHFLKDHNVIQTCWWVNNENQTIDGKLKVSYSGVRWNSHYDTIIVKCTFDASTGSLGGKWMAHIDTEEVVLAEEKIDVRHQINPPPEDTLPHVVTMCSNQLATALERRTLYEWVSYHFHLGVTRFKLYESGGLVREVAEVLGTFLSNGTVELVPFHDVQRFGMEENAFVLHTNDCLYSSIWNSRWVVSIATDAYLFVPPPESLFSLLMRNSDNAWITIGSQEWSSKHCRQGMDLGATDEWVSSPALNAFVIEWLTFRKSSIECADNAAVAKQCIGKAGNRAVFAKPGKVEILAYHEVAEPKDGGVHLSFDEVHKNVYPSLQQKDHFNMICSEKVQEDEFIDGYVRDTAAAEFSKLLRRSAPPNWTAIVVETPPAP